MANRCDRCGSRQNLEVIKNEKVCHQCRDLDKPIQKKKVKEIKLDETVTENTENQEIAT